MIEDNNVLSLIPVVKQAFEIYVHQSLLESRVKEIIRAIPNLPSLGAKEKEFFEPLSQLAEIVGPLFPNDGSPFDISVFCKATCHLDHIRQPGTALCDWIHSRISDFPLNSQCVVLIEYGELVNH